MIERKDLLALDKEEIINLFVEFANKVEKQIQQLQEEVSSLREENRQLKLPKNSQNSSRPPSQDIVKLPKQKSLRKSSGKKTGGQTGHQGSTLNQVVNPDHIITHKPSNKCPQCAGYHIDAQLVLRSKRQIVDIPPIRPEVTEHQVYQYQCNCGHLSQGQYPKEVTAPVKYGNKLTSFVSYLSTRQYIPFGRIPELLQNICQLSLSEGTIYNMLNRVAHDLWPMYQQIKESILQAGVVGSDETGVNVMGKNCWGWVWQTERETYIIIHNNRAYHVIEQEFEDGLPNSILVSDSLSAQLKTPALLHQLCLAHLLRELNAFIEYAQNEWAKKMKLLFEKAIKLKYNLSQSQYEHQNHQRDQIIHEFQTLINQPIDTKVPKLQAFQKRMVKRKDSIFTFLYHYDVPFDNNGSERAVRNIKVKQKVSGAFRSERGAEIFSIIRSVIDTWIKRDVNIFDAIILETEKKNLAGLEPCFNTT